MNVPAGYDAADWRRHVRQSQWADIKMLAVIFAVFIIFGPYAYARAFLERFHHGS